MYRIRTCVWSAALLLTVTLITLAPVSLVPISLATGAEKSAPDFLPESTAIYVEVSQPKLLLDTIFDHPLRQKLEAIEDYRKALETPQYAQFLLGVAVVENKLGMAWRQALEGLFEGGIYLAVDAKTQGAVILVKSRDAATLQKIRDTYLDLAREDARGKGQPDPVKSAEYRGVMAYRVGEARVATLGPWLVMSNKDETAKQTIDNYLDGSAQTLASNETFQTARKSLVGQPSAWAFVRLNMLRDAGLAKDLFKGKTDNPAAELLVGGIAATLQKTPFATATLQITPKQLSLAFAVPHDASWMDESRSYYFGPQGKGEAPPLLTTKNTLFSLSTYRDLAGLWAASADLFDEKVNAQMAQANSGLSTLFSGRDFGSDVLGSVRPDMQLVVDHQTFAPNGPQPAIKLPASAFVFRLKEPEKMQRQWKVTVQSLIGFLNVVGAMQGQPQLEMNNETVDGVQLVTSTYVPKEGEVPEKVTAINYNFAPTAAFSGELFILATNRQLALDLAKAAKEQTNSAAGQMNTQARLSIAGVRKALIDNQSHLVSQNMLEKGHDKEHAEKEIGALMAVLGVFQDAALRLRTQDNQLRLELETRLADEAVGSRK